MDFLHSVFPDNLACVFISIIDISHQKNFRESTLKIVQKTYNAKTKFFIIYYD